MCITCYLQVFCCEVSHTHSLPTSPMKYFVLRVALAFIAVTNAPQKARLGMKAKSPPFSLQLKRKQGHLLDILSI